MAILEITRSSYEGSATFEAAFDETADGPSLVAGWRARTGVVDVYADRLGFVPIFYWGTPDRFVVSSSLSEVVSRLPTARVDPAAVSVFLRLGYFIGDQTLVQGVRVLRPGARLSWSGALSLEAPKYPQLQEFTGTTADARAIYQERFRAAIAARTHHGVGRMTLSGGRDSRHILLELLAQGRPPRALVTLDRGNSDDHIVAAALARRFGLDLIRMRLDRYSLALEQEKNRLNHYQTDENTWYLAIRDALDGPVFDGLAGDVLSNGLYFDQEIAEAIRNSKTKAAAALLMQRSGGYLSYLTPEYGQRWNGEMALDAIEQEMRLFTNSPDPMKAFLFWNRTRREIALLPLAMAATRVPVRLPYLDDSLLSFLLSLPAAGYGAEGFHDSVIAEAYPEARGIPYASKRTKRNYSIALVGYLCRVAGHLMREPATRGRILAYVAESLLRWSEKPIDAPLSKLGPIVQAHTELGIGLK